MRILLVLSAAPRPDGEAVEVVAYEVARHAARLGHSVIVQVILRDPRASANSVRAEENLKRVDIEGGEICPPLYISDVLPKTRSSHLGFTARGARFLRSFRKEEMFPAMRLGPIVEARVREKRADSILSVWSWEALAATYNIRGVPKLVYYGNPDHIPAEARLRNPALFGLPCSAPRDRIALALQRVQNRWRKYLNVRMMRECEITANNSILDAKFYADHGHTRSIYLQNMWPDIVADGGGRNELVENADGVIRLIGSVGNLGATGNTFGLYYLGKELMPRLEARLAGRQLEVHILGKGTPSPLVARYMDHPSIVCRGWVDDIHREIRSAHAFLVLTNVSEDFLVGNTRILLAWALQACVIMHTNSRLAMPEIEHGRNALLGRTPDEIADLVASVAKNPALRERIGKGGYETFQAFYRSDVVVPKMLSLLQDLLPS